MLAFAHMPTGTNRNKDLGNENKKTTISVASTTMTCIAVVRQTRGAHS